MLQLQKLEVLARDEMLRLVADLLESSHPELYAEFKRMVNEAVRFPSHCGFLQAVVMGFVVDGGVCLGKGGTFCKEPNSIDMHTRLVS